MKKTEPLWGYVNIAPNVKAIHMAWADQNGPRLFFRMTLPRVRISRNSDGKALIVKPVSGMMLIN